MSNWRKIVTSGSFAELRRLDSGPISVTDQTYEVTQNVSLAGVNFLPNLEDPVTGTISTFQKDSSANFTGNSFRVNYYTQLGQTDATLTGLNTTDVENITDASLTTFGVWT